MMAERVNRLGGIALIAGGLAYVINILYGDIVYGGFRVSHVSDAMWGPINLLGMLGGILILLGLTALYVSMANRLGQMGLWAYVMSFISGTIFGVGFGVVTTVAIPLMNAADQNIWDLGNGKQPPAAITEVFLAAAILFVVGFGLWGYVAMRANSLPNWASWGFMAAAALALLGSLLRLAVPSINPLLADLGFLVLFVDVTAIGYRMLAGERMSLARAARAVT